MAIGLALRLAIILGLRTWDIPATDNHFGFGAEYGRMARWIVLGHGYASPYGWTNHAPTVIGSPLFAGWLALLFLVFGVYSPGAAVALLVGNSIVSVVMVPLAFWLARRLFGPAIAWVAALFVAFDPTLIWFSAAVMWESTLSCFVLTLTPALLLWVDEHPTFRRGVVAGLTLGIAAHLNMMALTVGTAIAAGLLLRSRRRLELARGLAALAGVLVLVVMPWSIRNSMVAGRPMLLRGGEEIALHDGNHVGATGNGYVDAMQSDPSSNRGELALYLAMGERRYLAYSGRRARDFIRSHPLDYLRLVALRAQAFWIGDLGSLRPGAAGSEGGRFGLVRFASYLPPIVLAGAGVVIARRRRLTIWPLLVTAIVFSLPYILVHCGGHRHRVPIEGTLVLLGSVALSAGVDRLRLAGRPPA